MKRILLLALAASFSIHAAIAQTTTDQRTQTTRTADLLATLPAQNTQQFNKAMAELAASGKTGILALSAMLLPPGKGDDSKVHYAISGFSAYVTSAGKEAQRKTATEAYCEVLQKLTDPQNKQFIIEQLALTGRDDAVSCLQAQLTDEKLADAAAQALVKINTSAAQQALLKALPKSSGKVRLSLVEALGSSRYREAASAIEPLAASVDNNEAKVALHALAVIGSPSSEKILKQAAEEAEYTYEKTNAVAAYLLYANTLNATGNAGAATGIAATVIKNAKADELVNFRSAALKLLAGAGKENSLPVLLKAAKNKNPEYQAAAIQFAVPYLKPANRAGWVKAINRGKPATRAGFVALAGDHGFKEALPLVLNATRKPDSALKLTAVKAAGKLGGEQALDALLAVLKNTDTAGVKAVKTAILTMEGNGVPQRVAAALPGMDAQGKVALIEILASRAAVDQLNKVLPYLKSQEAPVRKAAYAALRTMVAEKDLPELYTLISQAGSEQEIADVQQAIVAAVNTIPDSAARSAAVIKQLQSIPTAGQPAYYNVLAQIADKASLALVSRAFSSGNDQAKKEALTALAGWANDDAALQLYLIGQKADNAAYQKQAIDGYIAMAGRSQRAPDQKLLMLRNAMELAESTDQKKQILSATGNIKTFSGLLFAGEFMQDTAFSEPAAFQVINIGLSDKSFYGAIVRDLLTKAMDNLKGQDSDYLKESVRKHLAEMPPDAGFVPIFNGKDLTGWKGLVANPIERAKMDAKTLAARQKAADELMRKGWKVENGILEFTGEGDNLCTVKKYGDFEMLVDWKIINDGKKNGDAGIYLRGTPQVQIWDTARVADGAQVGSGGLYNNQSNPSKPLKVADNGLDQWNHFHIKMTGDRVTVHLNGELVTDSVILENYWDRKLPIFPMEQIELQAHGSKVAYRDIYVKEIDRAEPYVLTPAEKKEGYEILFDGTNLDNWTGNKKDYVVENGKLIIKPQPGAGSGGNLFTKKQYGDFVFRFEFLLTPGANNGLGIRAPMEGDAAYEGMELQILDNDADVYKDLKDYQFHGSVYGVLPAKRGFLKPNGEWNEQEVTVNGTRIKVKLNGTLILDGDIANARKNGAKDGQPHPGLKRDSGHIGFLGHGSVLQFRNIRVKELKSKK